MAAQLAVGAVLTFLSVAIQVLFIIGVMAGVERAKRRLANSSSSISRAVLVGAIALWLSLAHAVAIGLWASVFLQLRMFADFDTSLYFAAVAFTTLGFGDIIPPMEWRHLAGFSAANGLLMFGVSAAVLVEALREMRPRA